MSTIPSTSRSTKEERRRKKDLEEARKAGNAPPELDEEGKAINPHIPEFMAKAPWYMDTGVPSLKHHKGKEYNADPSKLKEQLNRGIKVQGATKYRKGACTNCGAMTHKAQDCLERPRKKGAKWTNKDIAPDEYLGGVKAADWDGKRDRWDGYDPASHKQVVDEYAALEEARRKLREEQLDHGDLAEVKKVAKAGKGGKKKKKDDDFGSSDESADEGDDVDKYADAADQAGQKLDAKTRITVRNLRIREDTAKYLMNLDVESAHYDPKTRAMREAPIADVAPEDAKFAGENFARASGSVRDVQRLQLFAWQSEQRGNNVHINANPTQGELLYKEFLEKKDTLKETSKVGILERYGGEEHLERVPQELLGGQTENYVEYSRSGQIVKGQERAKAKSKYDEDVYPGNHTSVWGSWYDASNGVWGFSCCHSVIKGSYCTGATGRVAYAADAATGALPPPSTTVSGSSKSLVEQMAENIRRKAAETAAEAQNSLKGKSRKRDALEREDEEDEREREERASRRRVARGEDIGQLRADRLAEARQAEKRRAEGEAVRDETDITEEQLEAYRLHRDLGHEDPMHNVKGDELLPL